MERRFTFARRRATCTARPSTLCAGNTPAIIPSARVAAIAHISFTERFPVPLSTASIQPPCAPALSNAFDSSPWIVMLFEQEPIAIDPFQEPVDGLKIGFFYCNCVNFAFTWHQRVSILRE